MVGSTVAAQAWPAAGQGRAGLRQVARTLRRLIARTRSERRSRSGIGEWRGLDDRLLADIGLPRAEALRMSFGPLDRRQREND